ncbi:C2H2-type zinc finger transcription factor [Phycomyces blakesleeanus]
MARLTDAIARTSEYVSFIKDLQDFHNRKGTRLQAEPVLGGKKLDLLKIYQVVNAAGGFEEVTKNRGWKQVGDSFGFPSTCTNSAYILKGLYIRNLLGWEEEKVWGKVWVPPQELYGPAAHKPWTLAGTSYRKKRQGQELPTAPLNDDSTSNDTNTSKRPCIESVKDAPYNEPIKNVDPQIEQVLKHDSTEIQTPANKFDANTKQRVLFALQFGTETKIEWALDYILTVSFEWTDHLQLNTTPILLDMLVSLASPSLKQKPVDAKIVKIEGNDNQTDTIEEIMNKTLNIKMIDEATQNSPTPLKRILKILHIIRNFSLVEINTSLLAGSVRLNDMLLSCLELSLDPDHLELGRQSIDILVNIASTAPLAGPTDAYISCLANLIDSPDRHLIIGSVRTLTNMAQNDVNREYLGVELIPRVTSRIIQLLLSNDEELIGTILEYLYQHALVSEMFCSQLLAAHSGAYVGLLVSLLSFRSKFFCPKIVRDDIDFLFQPQASFSPDVSSMSSMFCTSNVPYMPNLSAYQKLDEPYRCLGWLKDKFQVADPSSVVSLDDMYLLYESRFGLEKALKMKDFYTVLKIAFPSSPNTITGNSDNSTTMPVVEGLFVRGIQISLSILQDDSTVFCQWENCTMPFDDEVLLHQHVLNDHSKPDKCNIGSNSKDISCDSLQQPLTPVSVTSSPVSPSTTYANIDSSDIKGVALVAVHLLRLLSQQTQSQPYFTPYEKDLTTLAEQKPKLAFHIWSMFSTFTLA